MAQGGGGEPGRRGPVGRLRLIAGEMSVGWRLGPVSFATPQGCEDDNAWARQQPRTQCTGGRATRWR